MNKYQKGESHIGLLLIFVIAISLLLHFYSKENKKFVIKEVEFKSSVLKDVVIEAKKFKEIGLAESIVINYYKPCFEKNENYIFLYLNKGYIDTDCAIKAISIGNVEGGNKTAKETKLAIENWTNLHKTNKTYNDLYSK